MDSQMSQMLRSDAQDNRDRILTAARALFSEHGLDVTMHAIARRAGVGPATLYRRFPTKRALIDEAFAIELQSCRRIVEDGCSDPDPWHGFVFVIHELIALHIRNRGFIDALITDSAAPEVSEHRRRLLVLLAQLGKRAQEAGDLRKDFVIDDLILVLLAGRGLGPALRATRETTARRFAALVIDAFKESGTGSPSSFPSGSRRVQTS